MLRTFLLLPMLLIVMSTRSSGAFTMSDNSKLTVDHRSPATPDTLDTPRSFPKLKSLAEWEARREDIRQHLLVSLGLSPMPKKTALYPQIFDPVKRDGYTIEKVFFQTYPGLYLAGNLYRPLNPTAGRHPGILVTHGHWAEGRMADQANGSIAARAITFAREGCVAFTYDMVGYNDTRQISHKFANSARHWLWGISLMGLQTWNSIRALDFLCRLPEVDQTKLAITGESGGGTQTMILGAIDRRLAAVGPCVMVSHTMQGGCLCENAPGLRVDYSNMEIAAAAAPIPQVMTAATGDWTKTMMTVEGPAVASVYALYNKPEHLHYEIVDAPHNINKDSREIVNKFFGRWLLGDPNTAHFSEPPYKMEPVEELRVFPLGEPLPIGAISEGELTNMLIWNAEQTLESKQPKRPSTLAAFKELYTPVWKHTLNVEIPLKSDLTAKSEESLTTKEYISTRMNISRKGRGDSIPARLFEPVVSSHSGTAVVLVSPDGMNAFTTGQKGEPGALAQSLLMKGHKVLLLDCFLTGSRANVKTEAARNRPFEEYFSTYNRTDLQERIQDLITAQEFLRKDNSTKQVKLIGRGKAGLWSLLASPAFDGTAADCDNFDLTSDEGLLTQDMFVPGLRKLGDFRTAAALSAPKPLCLFHYNDKFTALPWIRKVYRFASPSSSLHINSDMLNDSQLAEWMD